MRRAPPDVHALRAHEDAVRVRARPTRVAPLELLRPIGVGSEPFREVCRGRLSLHWRER